MTLLNKDLHVKWLKLPSLTDANKALARSASVNGSADLLNLDLSKPANLLDNITYRTYVKQSLNIPFSHALALDPHARCICGFLLAEDPGHPLSCSKMEKIGRHDGLVDAARNVLAQAGYIHINEPHLDNGNRTDIKVSHPLLGGMLNFDMSVVRAYLPSRSKESAEETLFAAHAKEAEKCTKHAKACEQRGESFLPFVFDSMGACTSTLRRITSHIADTATSVGRRFCPTARQIRQSLLIALHKGNAAIVDKCLSMANIRAPKPQRR